jgi:Holliday junction resolvasome RuvABC endonuclease subunit
MIVVGVDLSLQATGIVRVGYGSGGRIYPEVQMFRRGESGITTGTPAEISVALASLCDNLAETIISANGPRVPPYPNLVLIESPALSRSKGGVFERGFLWYATVCYLVDLGIPVMAVDPGQLKLYATGVGNASKGGVIDAVARRLPMFETKGDDNLADASVLAAIGCDLMGAPLVKMPAAHRRALAKLTLPKGCVPVG